MSFCKAFLPITSALEKNIEQTSDAASKSKAVGLHSNICTFSFIVTLTTMSRFLSVTYHLSQSLQKETIDLGSAITKVSMAESHLSQIRTNANVEL